jgi:septal ring factor EnvC (AmiA/AmiB activator)
MRQERLAPQGAARHGLVIGVEKYRDARLNLGCARADAQAIYGLMVDPKVPQFVRHSRELEQNAEQAVQRLGQLQESLAQGESRIQNLNRQLHDRAVQAVISNERIAALEDMIRQQTEQSGAMQEQLANLAKSNPVVQAEK